MFKFSLLLCVTVALWGCQTPPDIKQLQIDNSALNQQLGEANREIGRLQTEGDIQEQDIAELNRVLAVLGQEKNSRVVESTNLRSQVRQFVQLRIDSLKDFLLASNLLDYIGGELVERISVDDGPVLVVDLVDVIPFNGVLTGLGGYFINSGTVSVKVLRPLEDKFIVVWSSQPVTVTEPGLQQLKFSVALGVERGDVLAYYFSAPGMVGFDTGTGDSRYLLEDVEVGTLLRRSSLRGGSAKRSYSVGVYGLLNAQ